MGRSQIILTLLRIQFESAISRATRDAILKKPRGVALGTRM